MTLFAFHGYSQKYLSVEKPRRFKRVKYLPGDKIYLQVQSKQKYNGVLESVNDSFLVVARLVEIPDPANPHVIVVRDTIKLSNIKSINTSGKGSMDSFLRMYTNTAIVGGVFLMAGGGGMALLEGQKPDKNSFLIAGGIMVSGIILKIFVRTKYKIGNRWQVKAMEPIIEGKFIERQ